MKKLRDDSRYGLIVIMWFLAFFMFSAAFIFYATSGGNVDDPDTLITRLNKLVEEGKAYKGNGYNKFHIRKGEYAYINLSKSHGNTEIYYYKDRNDSTKKYYGGCAFGYFKVNKNSYMVVWFSEIDVENEDGYDYDGYIINTDSISYLGVSSVLELYEILTDHENYNKAAEYKVGSDIPSGEYVLNWNGSWMYQYSISTDPNYDKLIDIYTTKKVTVTLHDGEYINLGGEDTLTESKYCN